MIFEASFISNTLHINYFPPDNKNFYACEKTNMLLICLLPQIMSLIGHIYKKNINACIYSYFFEGLFPTTWLFFRFYHLIFQYVTD